MRKVGILDVDAKNGYTNVSYVNAVEQMVKVCGFPYFVTTKVDSAVLASMVLVSSRLTITTFTSPEETAINQYVNNGGIFVGHALNSSSSFLKNLFGYTSWVQDYNLQHFNFTRSPGMPGMRWLDDSLELNMSLAIDTAPTDIKTISYIPSATASVGARYEDGSAALLIRQQGRGYAIAFGPQLRDLFSFAQQDIDSRGERAYSNFFEPGYDPIILFLKDFYTKQVPLTVWKHTIPNKKNTAVMITHDMDSKTSNDRALMFAQYERSRGITSTFNITTRYFSDYLMGPIYDMDARRQLDSAFRYYGMVLASHSVGHFPDMDYEARFPLGSKTGNDTSTYRPKYSLATGTVNGTVYGELTVSKKLIEESCRCQVRSFRTGYLTFHDQLVNALDSTGYLYSSSMSANDVMSHFPYRTRTDRASTGKYSKVYEIPMTISDVFFSDPITDSNYLTKLAVWENVTNKLSANFAPVNVLLHPNRDYKLDLLQRYISTLDPSTTDFSGFENHGDFWRYRDSLTFDSKVNRNVLTITIDRKYLPIRHKLGFVIDGARATINPLRVRVVNDLGVSIPFNVYDWYDSSLYVMFEPYSSSFLLDTESPVLPSNISDFRVYPNPFSDHIMIELFADEPVDGILEVYSMDGSMVFTQKYDLEEDGNRITIQGLDNLNSGQYSFIMRTKERVYSTTLIRQ